MLKQKLLGLGLVACGVLTAIPTGDATAAIMLVPIGLYTFFTKEKVCNINYEESKPRKKSRYKKAI